MLSEDDYLFNKAKYEAEIQSCKIRLKTLENASPDITIEEVKTNPYVTSMRKFARARVLTREMCVALIERIDVDKDNVIVITPKYRDAFAELCARIEKEESEMKQND